MPDMLFKNFTYCQRLDLMDSLRLKLNSINYCANYLPGYNYILNSNNTSFPEIKTLSNGKNDTNIELYVFCSNSLLRCILLSLAFGILIIGAYVTKYFKFLLHSFTVIFFCLLGTIIGNSFVIAAVILEKNLHNVANYLIVSLAFTDLTVAIMVS